MRKEVGSSALSTFFLPIMVFLLLGSFVLPSFNLSRSQAQAASPITPSGLNTQVNLSAAPPAGKTQYDITGGTRPGGGTNLFHSFGNFNVPTNNIANFLNDSGLATTNILGRVNGGNPSTIFGTIQTTNFGNANLFLMNPAGFLFGSNATVNVGGMVAFTTADYLRLQDIGGGNAGNFHADPTQASVLTSAPVAAFGFLGSNPAAIAVQGSTLAVQPGQSISFVGGNKGFNYTDPDTGIAAPAPVPGGITMTGGKLLAPSGQINLASVASPGEILAGTMNQAPNVNGQSFGALGSVQISKQSVIDVSGAGGGTVLIRGGQFVLDNSTISANITGPGPIINGAESIGGGIDIVVSQNAEILTGSLLQTNVVGNATPGVTYGGTHIKADRIEIIGDPGFDLDNGPFTEIHSDVAVGSTGGNSGPIKLEANSILLQDFVTLQAHTNGKGNGGDIILHSTGNLEINGSILSINSGFDADPGSIVGNGGNIELTSTSGNVLMTNAPFITSQAFEIGTVGHITVSALAGDVLLSDFEGITGVLFTHDQGTAGIPGKGGIQITAKDLTIVNSGIQIDNFTSVQPGDLTVNLTGTLKLNGLDHLTTLLTSTRREARSANLNITAHDIVATGNSQIATDTFRNGEAGSLNISTQTLELTDGAQIRSNSSFNPFPQPGVPPITPSGAGGTITIQGQAGPAQTVLIDGKGSGIFTNTQGTGAGGSMNISATSLTVQNGGTLSAQTTGPGNAGSILVKGDSVSITGGAQITSSSSMRKTPAFKGDVMPPPSGNAGTVTIQGTASPAQSVLIDGDGSGIFTDTHGTGTGGNITLNANTVTLQNGGTLSAATSGTAASATGGGITINANQLQVNSGGLVTASTTGAGAGGSVNINAGTNFNSNAGTVSSTATQATGGNINLVAGQAVTLSNGASISASSSGAGNAGAIMINAGQNFISNNSSVTTQANQASGGTIKITTSPSGTVLLTNSTISASVLDGTGGGGSVNIDPQFVILQNSQILANAVRGPGGNISILTNLLFPDANSRISASSQFGVNGTVTVQSPNAPATGKIIPLSQKPLTATALLSQRCAALAEGELSSFIVAGRDSLPAEPGGWLSSPLAALSADAEPAARGEGQEGTTLGGASPAGETALLSLRRIAPPGFLTQAFAADWSAGCSS